MHYLFRVLMKVPKGAHELCPRKAIIGEIRESAVEYSEMFNGGENLFDWREENTAGAWAKEYPENVLLGYENPDKLLQELLNQQQREKSLVEGLLLQIDETGEKSLRSLVEDSPADKVVGLAYDIGTLARLLGGYVSPDSAFLADGGTGRVSDDLIQKVKANPGKWAMVFFDHHI